MATLPMSSMPSMSAIIPATPTTIPLTGPRIRRVRQASAARDAAIERRLRRQHAPRGWERTLLWLSLAPHRLPEALPSWLPREAHLILGTLFWRCDGFWDSFAVGQALGVNRPLLRLGLARERVALSAALRHVEQAQSGWPRDDAQWRQMIRDLYDTLGVVVEVREESSLALGSWQHYVTCGLSPARRRAQTQPTLDALLLDADDLEALARPHDASTQPALSVVRPAVR